MESLWILLGSLSAALLSVALFGSLQACAVGVAVGAAVMFVTVVPVE